MAEEKAGLVVKVHTQLKKRDVITGEVIEVIEREFTMPLAELTGEQNGNHDSGNDGNS